MSRPPARFYVVGFAAIAFSIAGLLLSVQEEESLIAAGATAIGALGFFACYFIAKRDRSR
jgi:hypothetical protein